MAKKRSRGGSQAPPKEPAPRSFPQYLLHDTKSEYGAPMTVEELHPLVWTVSQFFHAQECREWIRYMESCDLQETNQRATKYTAQRSCFRLQLDDETIARRLFHRLARVPDAPWQGLGQLTGCNPNIRLYKYTKGMSFGRHIDESNIVSHGITRVTVLVYLSGCLGGATRFYDETTFEFEPRLGSMLLHVHGDECLEHEGCTVQAGVKYVLRTDLVYQR